MKYKRKNKADQSPSASTHHPLSVTLLNMVAISKSFLLLLGTAIACATAQKTPAPKSTPAPKPTPAPAPVYSPQEMSQVVDCQTQCISLIPPFGHKPDINVAEYMRVDDHGRMPYMIKNMQPIVKVLYMFTYLSNCLLQYFFLIPLVLMKKFSNNISYSHALSTSRS